MVISLQRTTIFYLQHALDEHSFLYYTLCLTMDVNRGSFHVVKRTEFFLLDFVLRSMLWHSTDGELRTSTVTSAVALVILLCRASHLAKLSVLMWSQVQCRLSHHIPLLTYLTLRYLTDSVVTQLWCSTHLHMFLHIWNGTFCLLNCICKQCFICLNYKSEQLNILYIHILN